MNSIELFLLTIPLTLIYYMLTQSFTRIKRKKIEKYNPIIWTTNNNLTKNKKNEPI